MDFLMVIGVLCIGLVIGTLVGWYVNEEGASFRAVAGAVYLLAGSGVVAIFYFVNPMGPTREYWFYPIGIFVAFFASPYLDVHYTSVYKTKKKV